MNHATLGARFFRGLFAVALATTALGLGAAGCALDTAPESTEASDDELRLATYKGTLVSIAGIGGESTGYGLQTATQGTLELDLATFGWARSFEDGASAKVTGYFKTVRGVEIPKRRVLVVVRMVKESSPAVKCGDATCGAGLVCCNPLRGICTKPGDFCIQ